MGGQWWGPSPGNSSVLEPSIPSAPSANATGWMPEPATRGTFRLLVGCLATLSLCVYTALHLNVPPLGREPRPSRERGVVAWYPSFSLTFPRKPAWVLVGMFAPELVVYTAWSQWRAARRLTDAVTKILHEKDQQATNTEWTMTHSFFAIMGGFAVDTGDGEDAYVVGSPRLHLTADGVVVLAKLGQLPAVPVDLIRDKSKANHFAKLLVLMQAGWLAVECATRAASHLPLTLLELNTVAHVACALVAYALWWNKPLDVEQPMVLDCGKQKRPLIAAMCMFSQRNLGDDRGGSAATTSPEIHDIFHFVSHDEAAARGGETGFPAMELTGPLRIVSYKHQRGCRGSAAPPDSRTMTVALDSSSPFAANSRGDEDMESHKIVITLYSGDVLLPFGFAPNIGSASAELSRHASSVSREASISPWKAVTAGGHDHKHTTRPVAGMNVDQTTITRWGLACQSLREHEAAWSRYRAVISRASVCDGVEYVVYKYRPGLPPEQLDFVVAAVPNWPGRHLIPYRRDRTGAAFFALCVFLYGGVHAVAWNDYFPSEMERHLWHISSIYVTASGLLWLALKATRNGLSWIRESYFKGQSDRIGPLPPSRPWIGYFVTPLGAIAVMIPVYLIAAASCVYVAARLYLVLEAFISLRDVPPDVYSTPEWTRYLIHF